MLPISKRQSLLLKIAVGAASVLLLVTITIVVAMRITGNVKLSDMAKQRIIDREGYGVYSTIPDDEIDFLREVVE